MPASERASGISATIGVGAVLAASTLIRWPGFTQGGLASHDVGGILYNAMLLRSGLLPYVDSVEWKAPGSFYVAAVVAGPEGRDIAALQVAANLTALASLAVVAAIAWRLWGARAAIACAALFAAHDAMLDSMDANYVTWALLPAVAAVLVAVLAGQRTHVSRYMSLGTWLLSGALCGLATLCKQPAGVVLAPVLVHALRGRDWRAGASVLLGFVAAHAPIGAHYLAHGQLAALVRSYTGATWGFAYIGHHAGTPPLAAAWEGLAATLHFLALPLALALFVAAARPRRADDEAHAYQVLLWTWVLAALVGAAVGLRFYKGYFLGVLPPLCLLAVAPWGLLGADFWRRGALRWLAAPALAVLLARAAVLLQVTRVDRAMSHDDGARKISRHILKYSEPGDRIWVWGWHLWGVYAYSGRLSASPLYKTPGLLTQFDDDTWRRPSTPVQLIADGPHAARLIADLAAARPRFIAIGGSVPRERFVALRELLAAGYAIDRRTSVGKVEIWRRRDP